MKKILSIVLVIVTLVSMSACNKNQDMVTITFDSSGGTTIESQTIEAGQSATRPTNPEKEGFSFIEWQLDGTPYNFETPVTNNITLIAVYEMNQGVEVVHITLDYQNGQDMGLVEIIKGGTMTEPPIPQKQGYKFVGWTFGDVRFDFSSTVSEDITLIATWEIEETTPETEKPSTNTKPNGSQNPTDTKPNGDSSDTTPSTNGTTPPSTNETTPPDTTTGTNETTTPDTTPPETSGNTTQNTLDYEKTMLPYEGTWYLKGYADVYIYLYNIYESGGWASLSLDAFNIAIPSGVSSPVSPYTIYPYDAFVENPSTDYWSSGFQIMCDPQSWQKEIEKHNLKLGENCIYLGGKQFVRDKGSITMYDDTCYKSIALDAEWYMEGNPDSYIYFYKRQDLGALGDYIEISMRNFNINTLATSGSGNVRLYAARKNNWDKYGIQVNNGVLTISNSNGTKRFHRNAIKITGKTDINLKVGETEKLYAMVLPQTTTDQSVTWTSSDASVATVSGRTVKAVGKGTAILTATSKVGGHTATCKITVTETPLTVSAHISDGIEISGSEMYGIVTASMSKSGGSLNYTTCVLKLYYNGTLVSETSGDSITVRKASGEYRVEVYVKDSSGNEATATKTITY